jgi:hypothetical protein
MHRHPRALVALIAPLTLLPLALAGCPEGGPETYVFAPGPYIMELGEVESGDCEFESVAFNAASAEVELREADDGFVWEYPAGDLYCAMSGDTFTCDTIEFFTTDLDDRGKDASVTTSFSQEGVWTAEDSQEGTFTYLFSCVGEDCDQGGLEGTNYGDTAQFPCTLSGPYLADKVD